MIKFLNVIYIIGFCLLVMSCASTNGTKLSENEKIITENFSNYQKGYSLKIPNNWVGYIDTHCQFAYKPKKAIKNGFSLSIRVVDSNLLQVNDSVTSLEDFTNVLIQSIKKANKNPRLSLAYNKHSIYKKYSIVSYKTSFLGANYNSINVSFYYNSKPYIVIYFAQQEQFPNYLEDFATILETFKIVD